MVSAKCSCQLQSLQVQRTDLTWLATKGGAQQEFQKSLQQTTVNRLGLCLLMLQLSMSNNSFNLTNNADGCSQTSTVGIKLNDEHDSKVKTNLQPNCPWTTLSTGSHKNCCVGISKEQHEWVDLSLISHSKHKNMSVLTCQDDSQERLERGPNKVSNGWLLPVTAGDWCD